MVDKPLERVRKFHETFGVSVPNAPVIPSREVCALRIALIQEELNELKEAFDNNDLVEVADALGDLSVVVDGTYDACGLSEYKEALSEEIFNSNMSKLDENGEVIRREDGKILKGPNFFPPNIAKVIGLDEDGGEPKGQKDAA